MSATDTFESEMLNLIFLNDNIDQIGDATGIVGSTGAGNLELSLSTAALDDTSNQNTTEATYTGYARQDIGRSGANWTVSGTNPTIAANDNVIQFGQNTGGAQTVTDVGIGSDVVANELFLYEALDASLNVATNVNPQFAASALDISVA